MIDQHDLYSQAARRFSPPPDAFDRLQRRRAQRRRNQRVTAAVAALVIVAIVFGAFARAINGAAPSVPADHLTVHPCSTVLGFDHIHRTDALDRNGYGTPFNRDMQDAIVAADKTWEALDTSGSTADGQQLHDLADQASSVLFHYGNSMLSSNNERMIREFHKLWSEVRVLKSKWDC